MAINPYVPASATGNGTQVDFTFTFPYISTTHIKAFLNGVQTTAFTFFSTNVLRFISAPSNGIEVKIIRETPADTLAAVIQPGGPLSVNGLNNNFIQTLYYSQETQYDAANQSTAGLQAQITTATNTANTALTTANTQVTFTQSGAGAVGRSLTSKLQETVSVKDFGAIGDGIADDTVAIANAILSAKGIIYFPEGSYRVTSGFTVSKPVKIQGEGAASLISYEGIGTLFTFTYSQGGFAYQDVAAPYSIDSISICKTASSLGEVADCCIELRYTGVAGVIGTIDKLYLNNVFISTSAYPSNPLGTYWRKGLYLNRSAGVYAVDLSIVNNTTAIAGTSGTYGIHIKNDLTGHNMVRTFSGSNTYLERFDKCVYTEGNASANGGIESLYFSLGEMIGNYGIYTNKGDAIAIVGVHINAVTQVIQFNNSSIVRVVGCDLRSQFPGSPATANALVYWSGNYGTWTGNTCWADFQAPGVFKFSTVYATIVGNFMSGSGGATAYGITIDSGSSEVRIGHNTYANLSGNPSVLNNSAINTIYIDPQMTTAADGSIKTLDGRFQFTAAGFLKASQNGSYIGAAGTTYEHQLLSSLAGRPTTRIHNFNSSFDNDAAVISTDRANSSAFNLLALYTSFSGTTDAEFRFRGDGTAFCDGSWTGGGADYAEFFEWADGNPGNIDRRGISVVLSEGKIRPATTGESPIGVVSSTPSVVGDAAWNNWAGKYERDEFGSYILEDYETENEDGLTVVQQRRKLSPAFNPNLEYIPREDRPEWATIGMLGKLVIRKGQPTGSGWRKLRDVSVTTEQWLVR